MENQMKFYGGLQNILKSRLIKLKVGEATELLNCSFAAADIQECCDQELSLMEFAVSTRQAFDVCGNKIRLIQRIS